MEKLRFKATKRMKQDMNRVRKQGKDMSKLKLALDILATQRTLPPEYLDHKLSGNKAGLRECHLEPDWLLVYKIFENELILSATATGSHSQVLDL
jgi:mRNA interferase YafQ